MNSVALLYILIMTLLFLPYIFFLYILLLQVYFIFYSSGSLSRFMSGSRLILESGSLLTDGLALIVFCGSANPLCYSLSAILLIYLIVLLSHFLITKIGFSLHCPHCHGPLDSACFHSSLRRSPNLKPARRTMITT